MLTGPELRGVKGGGGEGGGGVPPEIVFGGSVSRTVN